MSNKMLGGLFSKKLLNVMNQLLDDFILSDSNEEEIYEELKYINESVRSGLYLLSVQKGFVYLSQKINSVNKKINLETTEKFIKSFDNGEVNQFLAPLGKEDKVSLLSHLGVDLPLKNGKDLSKKQLEYYKVISASIKESQKDDKRDGIESFLKHRQNKA